MTKTSLLLVPLLLLAAPAPAQEPTTATASPLTLRTAEMRIARNAHRALGAPGTKLPELPKDHHYVLTLDDGGVLSAATAAGPVEGVQLEARPRLLVQVFAEPFEEARAQAKGVAQLAGAMSGADLGGIVDALFDVPAQTDLVRLRQTGDPQDREQGLSIQVEVLPVAGTPFGDLLGALQAGEAGAPEVTDKNAQLRARLNLAPKSVDALAKSMLPLIQQLSGMGKTEQQRALMQKGFALIDGTLGIAMQLGGAGASMVVGVRDPAAAAELMHSEEARKVSEQAYADSPMFADDPVFEEFDHRGVRVLRVKLPLDPRAAMGNPFLAGQQQMTTAGAVAGDYQVMSMFGDGNGIRGLVDAALDQKITRSQLSGGAFFQLDAAIAAIARQMTGMAPPDAPERFDLTLARSGTGVTIQVHVR